MDFDSADSTSTQAAALRARWEAVEAFKARELAEMTDERAAQIIQWLTPFEPRHEVSTTSGLVEQQAIFHKLRRR